jgi:hypothetical protein
MDGISLEAELARQGESQGGDASDLFGRYKAVKTYLEKEYYPWIQASCPYFTDHGEVHVNGVIESASELLSNRLNPDKENVLKSIEIFEILCGIIWHDIGNAIGRVDHAKKIEEISNKVKELAFPNVTIHRHVVEIGQAHAGKSGLQQPEFESNVALSKNFVVHPRAYAAIVRFADEISENRNRISHSLLIGGKIPEENRIFWEYANCISASIADSPRSRVIISYEIGKDVIIKEFPFEGKLYRGHRVTKTKKPFIYYLISRLEKANNERIYCNLNFGGYSFISNIEARFIILDGTKRVDGYSDLKVILSDGGINDDTYPQNLIFDDFFEKHEKWTPEKIKQNLGL